MSMVCERRQSVATCMCTFWLLPNIEHLCWFQVTFEVLYVESVSPTRKQTIQHQQALSAFTESKSFVVRFRALLFQVSIHGISHNVNFSLMHRYFSKRIFSLYRSACMACETARATTQALTTHPCAIPECISSTCSLYPQTIFSILRKTTRARVASHGRARIQRQM
jgi:hypothetical protein